jgi:hypothetical protein
MDQMTRKSMNGPKYGLAAKRRRKPPFSEEGNASPALKSSPSLRTGSGLEHCFQRWPKHRSLVSNHAEQSQALIVGPNGNLEKNALEPGPCGIDDRLCQRSGR